MKLICFPYAGAHVNVFADLQKKIERDHPGIQVMTLDYAGHGRRFSEKPFSSIHDIARDLHNTLTGEVDPSEELVLLGYSMGALVAYEMARLLEGSGYRILKLIFMAATPPHRVETQGKDIEGDDELIEHCKIYGLINEKQFDSPHMRRLFLPALRSDIMAVHQYNLVNKFEHHSFDMAVDIAIFQGLGDLSVSDVDDWSDLSDGEISSYRYPGGHFFLYEHQGDVFKDIAEFLTNSEQSII